MENTLLVGDFLLVNKAVFGATSPSRRRRCRPSPSPARRCRRLRAAARAGQELRQATRRHARRHARDAQQDALPERPAAGRAVRAPFRSRRHLRAGHVLAVRYAAARVGDACRPTRDNWGPSSCRSAATSCSATTATTPRTPATGASSSAPPIKGKPLFIYYSFDPYGRAAAVADQHPLGRHRRRVH
jgi:hypothetical protein